MGEKNLLDEKIEMLEKEVGEPIVEKEAVGEPAEIEAVEAAVGTEKPTEATEPSDQPSETKAVETENQYQPDFKFKVHDQEYEFDEFVRPTIKDKEVESKLRDLYTKAYGLETAQKSRDNWKTKYEETEKTAKVYQDILDVPLALYKDGKTVESVLSMYKKEDILNAAKHIIEAEQASPEQKKIMEENFNNITESYHRRRAESSVSEEASLALQQAVTAQVELELMKSDYSEIANFVDSKLGKGTFKAEVFRHGDTCYKSGRKIQPTEAVKEVYERFKPFYTTNSSTATAPTNTVKKVVAPTSAKTIPNIKSSGSSGRPSKPKSMGDLDRLEQELSSQL